MPIQANVVLFLFRKTQSVPDILQQIHLYGPKTLYLVLDRSDPDTESALKGLVSTSALTCELQWVIPDEHKGIGRIFDFGLSEVFKHEDSIIILEDDTLPSLEFFDFCNQQLLQKNSNPTVSSIIGTPLSASISKAPFSSRFGFPYWGWATWKDRWKSLPADDQFFQNLEAPQESLQLILNTFVPTKGMNISWDVRWSLWQFMQGWTTIVSGKNLISNTGFNALGTFTKNNLSAFSQITTHDAATLGTEVENPEQAYWELIWTFLSEYRQA